jgi:hypothetical protein
VRTALLEGLPALLAAEVQPDGFADVLATAVVMYKPDDEDSLEAVRQLVESPAAASLDASEVYTVCVEAAQFNRAELLTNLCELPAAKQLSPEELYEVMSVAVRNSKKAAAGAAYALCTQLKSVAVQMQAQQVYRVAFTVAELAGSKEAGMTPLTSLAALEALGQLPGMQQISVDGLNGLVFDYITSLGESDDKVSSLLTVLLSAPSAQQLEQVQITRLVCEAITRQLYGCTALLLHLPAAQQMDTDHVYYALYMLLQHMSSCEHFKAAEDVCAQMLQLPAVQQCTDHDMFDKCVSVVVHLPQRLQHKSGTADVEGIAYVAQRHVVLLEQLLAVPAAQGCTMEDGDEMLRYTLQRCPAAAKVLCSKLPELQQLAAPSILALLTSALGRPEQAMQQSGSCSSEAAIGCLCALPGSQQLQPQALQRLLQGALLQGALLQDKSTAVECLASVEGPAAGIAKEALLDLLHTAVRRKSDKVSDQLTDWRCACKLIARLHRKSAATWTYHCRTVFASLPSASDTVSGIANALTSEHISWPKIGVHISAWHAFLLA